MYKNENLIIKITFVSSAVYYIETEQWVWPLHVGFFFSSVNTNYYFVTSNVSIPEVRR